MNAEEEEGPAEHVVQDATSNNVEDREPRGILVILLLPLAWQMRSYAMAGAVQLPPASSIGTRLAFLYCSFSITSKLGVG